MIRKLALSTVLALGLAAPALASGQMNGPLKDMVLGTTPQAIAKALTDQGYEMIKYEQEHGRIEVKAMKDGRKWELKIDPKSGKVTRVEHDD